MDDDSKEANNLHVVVGLLMQRCFVFYSDFKYSTSSRFSWLVSPSLRVLS
jgi:hypothetical protein